MGLSFQDQSVINKNEYVAPFLDLGSGFRDGGQKTGTILRGSVGGGAGGGHAHSSWHVHDLSYWVLGNFSRRVRTEIGGTYLST